ncbi:MAG: bis(5'-nucleosyl)-tetraphosphatase (symmetrical) YqeK [Spirochaetaceae bacterium]
MNYINNLSLIDNYLQNNLSQKRYNHSTEVAKMSKEISMLFNIDSKKSFFAGLCHDIAREFKISFLKEEILKHSGFSKDFYLLPQLFHGPVGASFLTQKFDIVDPEILEAVCYHSIGHSGIGYIAKVVFVADYISRDRTHIDNNFRNYILNLDLDNMIIKVVDKSKEYLLIKGKTILTETETMYNHIMRWPSEKET